MRNIASVATVRRRPLWIAVVAAAALSAIALGGVLLASRPNSKPTAPGPAAALISPDPSPQASPSAAPELVAAAAPFVCRSSALTAQNAPAVSTINALRTGAHSGYDRLTVQFTAAQPASVDLRPQAGTGFTQGASGLPMTLAGSHGILVVIHGADLHTSYSGSTDLKPRSATLAEVRQVEDFEGVVQLGLGLNGPACYRASFLTSPARLVIDLQVT